MKAVTKQELFIVASPRKPENPGVLSEARCTQSECIYTELHDEGRYVSYAHPIYFQWESEYLLQGLNKDYLNLAYI